MRAHRRGQHFGRKRHEFGVDGACEDDRKLDETGNLIEELGIRFQRQLLVGGSMFETPADHLLAAILVEDDVGLTKTLDIIRGVTDANLARRQKAMPTGRSTDRNPVDRHQQNFAIEQTEDRDQRPHPTQGRGRVAHRFGPGQLGHSRSYDFGQHLSGGPTGVM